MINNNHKKMYRALGQVLCFQRKHPHELYNSVFVSYMKVLKLCEFKWPA